MKKIMKTIKVTLIFLFVLLSCTFERSPEHINDAMNCKASAISICGTNNMQSECFKTAQRECMYWNGYRLKKGKLVKINSCEGSK